jgi:hypothetical protein
VVEGVERLLLADDELERVLGRNFAHGDLQRPVLAIPEQATLMSELSLYISSTVGSEGVFTASYVPSAPHGRRRPDRVIPHRQAVRSPGGRLVRRAGWCRAARGENPARPPSALRRMDVPEGQGGRTARPTRTAPFVRCARKTGAQLPAPLGTPVHDVHGFPGAAQSASGTG